MQTISNRGAVGLIGWLALQSISNRGAVWLIGWQALQAISNRGAVGFTKADLRLIGQHVSVGSGTINCSEWDCPQLRGENLSLYLLSCNRHLCMLCIAFFNSANYYVYSTIEFLNHSCFTTFIKILFNKKIAHGIAAGRNFTNFS